jgi:hypothetical protein
LTSTIIQVPILDDEPNLEIEELSIQPFPSRLLQELPRGVATILNLGHNNNNESRENISEFNSVILNNNNSTSSFKALNFPMLSFTRVYFFINSYYHLDLASPFFPIQHKLAHFFITSDEPVHSSDSFQQLS